MFDVQKKNIWKAFKQMFWIFKIVRIECSQLELAIVIYSGFLEDNL